MSRRKSRRRGTVRLNKPAQEVAPKVENSVGIAVPNNKSSIADLISIREALKKQGQEVSHDSSNHHSIASRPGLNDNQTEVQKQKIEIWQTAINNAQHYEEQALIEGKPWFRCKRHGFQYAEFVMITPDMAAEALKSQMTPEGKSTNRNVSSAWLESYKRDIKNDRWIPSQEGIAFNMSGNMFDGQHRLLAILETNKAYPMWVCWNVLDEAKFVTDSGKKRSVAEKLSMVISTKLGNRTAGVCKALMRGASTRQRYSESEVAEFALKWESLILWLKEHVGKQRVEVQAAIGKAYLWYGKEAVEDFSRRLDQTLFTNENDPALLLNNAIKPGKNTKQGIAFGKTLQAIEAEVEKREIKRLHMRDGDLFDWEEGWEVPQE